MEANVFYTSMEEMVKKFLLVIPNIAAAIAILVIGYIIARILKGVIIKRAVAQTNRLPFDKLRANGDMLKSCDFSAHTELVEA